MPSHGSTELERHPARATIGNESLDRIARWTHWGFYALIVLHVLAAIYHHFILKDGLIRRMWFGKRV